MAFHEVAKKSDHIIVGEVVLHRDVDGHELKAAPAGPGTMEIKVLRVLKGHAPHRVLIWGGLGSCSPSVARYDVGTVWAFVLPRSSNPGIEYELQGCAETSQRLPKSPAVREKAIHRLRVEAGIQ